MASSNAAQTNERNTPQVSESVAACGLVKPQGDNLDIAWQWNSLKDIKDRKKVNCDWCGFTSSGGITRAKKHQMGVSGDCKPCRKTPPDVVEILKKDAQEKSKAKKLYIEQLLEGNEEEEVELQEIAILRKGKRPATGSSLPTAKRTNVKGPIDIHFMRDPETTLKLGKTTS